MKFRIWNENDNDFIYVDLYDCKYEDDLAPLYEYGCTDLLEHSLPLEDSDGNEVFENDIVEEEDKTLSVISEDDFWLLDELSTSSFYVLRNIHENPGLI